MRNELERTITQAPPMCDGHPGVYGEIAGYYDAFLCEDAWLQKTNGFHSPVEGIYRAWCPRVSGCSRSAAGAGTSSRRCAPHAGWAWT